eukprot:m.21973 g.21973  ORF g.21973 m.21973 type:complete len:86 (+) comp7304_c0_seq2:208-465(+)
MTLKFFPQTLDTFSNWSDTNYSMWDGYARNPRRYYAMLDIEENAPDCKDSKVKKLPAYTMTGRSNKGRTGKYAANPNNFKKKAPT